MPVPAALADDSVTRAPAAGERIVFLGDSITQGGAGPGGYVTLVREAIAAALPDKGVEVLGAGISGNKVPDLELRLDRDVLAKKPTTVVVYIGINDVWHSQRGQGTPKEAFDKGLRSLVERIRAGGARVILCTPSVIGEKPTGENPLDAMLDEYSAVTRGVAADLKTGLLDLRKAFIDHLAAANAAQADKGTLTTDGVHLNAAGNRFVADRMLEALGVAAGTTAGGDPAKKLRHVVLFKFKDDSTPADVARIVAAFRGLPAKITEIDGFEWGTDVSPEGKSQGFTHCFLVTFKTEADRDAYLPHPAHKEFVSIVGPHVDKVCVVDFWGAE
jgi:lysophospholipase L1-like esterase